MKKPFEIRRIFSVFSVISVSAILLFASCAAPPPPPPTPTTTAIPTQTIATEPAPLEPTPLPTRLRWEYGDVLPYAAQSGDTLQALAAHFNTTTESIQQLNQDIDFAALTTLKPAEPLNLPASYAPLVGTPYHIIPDDALVYGPGQGNIDLKATITGYDGFLSRYAEFTGEQTLTSWDIVERVARDYSISPRLLLALIEFRSGALTRTAVPGFVYPLGHRDPLRTGLYKQLEWAAEQLSIGYYGWRSGTRVEVNTADGEVERLDFWQNAGTAALHSLFAATMKSKEFEQAVSPEGFGATYQELFGDPFKKEVTLIPADLRQPELALPFLTGKTWAFTGGPHPVWGDNTPWAALDFAPPAVVGGCGVSTEWIAAMADGVIARSNPDEAVVVLDLDGDGNEHTGWNIFYFHVGKDEMASAGKLVKAGDPIGHPSCEGGRATGTHVHVARRYNGEWIPADGALPFVLSGWTAHAGDAPYKGTLTYDFPALQITACTCVTANNSVTR